MNKRRLDMIIIVLTLFVIAGFWLMFSSNPIFESQHARKSDSTLMPEATGITDNIGITGIVEQSFICSSDSLSSLAIVFNRNSYQDAQLVIELSDDYQILASIVLNTADIDSQHRTFVYPETRLTDLKNKKLIMRIYSINGVDSGIGIMYNDKAASRFRFGSSYIDGSICFAIED